MNGSCLLQCFLYLFSFLLEVTISQIETAQELASITIPGRGLWKVVF
jgi:hypothetical protein